MCGVWVEGVLAVCGILEVLFVEKFGFEGVLVVVVRARGTLELVLIQFPRSLVPAVEVVGLVVLAL